MSAVPVRASGACRHCLEPVIGGAAFCCRGCEVANEIIAASDLEAFYELRGDRSNGPPRAASLERAGQRQWLETAAETLSAADDLVTIEVGISGLYCAACVWLIERAALREPGLARIVINPARQTACLTADSSLSLAALAAKLEHLGYRLVAPDASHEPVSSDLLARTGIAVALALNSMVLGAAIYLGLRTGWLHDLFIVCSGVLALGSLIVGGGVFARRAFAAIRERAISLDIPITLGIVLVFVSSLWAALSGDAGGVYFDTLSVFVALMLAGRLLSERVLSANRARVNASRQALELGARRIEAGRPRPLRADELRPGDIVLVAPGEVVPTDIELLDARAGCRLDWITGESEPRLYARGETIVAGAAHAGRVAFRGQVLRALADTALPDLLAAPAPPSSSPITSSRVAGLYLLFVLGAAGIGLGGWLLTTGDVLTALGVAAAVLVVTCPCALGIGAPLAFELVAARLARAGAFVRTARALPALARVRQVVFDKTGTVTENRLALASADPLAALTPRQLHVLFNLATRSAHPRSEVIASALDGRFDASIDASEEPGGGVEATVDGHRWRLGHHAWATGASGEVRADTTFAVDGAVLATLPLTELLRHDAAVEMAALTADGISLALLSGDHPARVSAVGAALGVEPERTRGGASPDDKARWVAAHDAGDLLFVGDGLNDALAFDAATVSATPSFESPMVAGRADLYFSGSGLRPVRVALAAARLLRRIHRAQLGFVVAYNAIVVTIALAGLMQPVLAAVLMPAGSLLVTTATALAVSKGAPWESSPS